MEDSPCPALLDLCDVELEEAVEPLHEFLSARGVRVSSLSAVVGVCDARGVGARTRRETDRDSPILTADGGLLLR